MKLVQMDYPLLGKQFEPYLKGIVVGVNLKTGRDLLMAIDPLEATKYPHPNKIELVGRVTGL